MVLALAKWRYSLVIIMRLGYVIIYVTRNYGPSGLRCSLRLRGYIISIIYTEKVPLGPDESIDTHIVGV